MEAFLLGLENLLQPSVLIAIVIGSVGGLTIGAIPGIGPAIAIAILLPATIFLEDLVFERTLFLVKLKKNLLKFLKILNFTIISK